MVPLAIAVLALFVGPLLMRAGRGSARLQAGIDGLAVALVVGASAVWLVPHAWAHAGLWGLLGVSLGAATPVVLRRIQAPREGVGIGLALLGAHVLLDGAALAVFDGVTAAPVAIAVAAHRIPVGMAVALRTGSGAMLTLSALAGLTVAGYLLGLWVPMLLSDTAHGVMEGAVAGVLMHLILAHPKENAPTQATLKSLQGASFTLVKPTPLVFAPATAQGMQPSCGHAHHRGHHGENHLRAPDVPPDPFEHRFSALGVVLGVGLLFAFGMAMADANPAGDHVIAAGQTLLTLTLTSAPALLAGFVFAGIASAVLPSVRIGGDGPVGQAVGGVLFGLPLPICSCGVVPMYQSLIRRGAPLTAGLAFLVATPELGLDALLLSLPLLGFPLTMARLVAAVLVALTVALVVGASESTHLVRPSDPVEQATPLPRRLREGLRYGLVDLVDHTLPWIVLGLGIAALAEPLIDHEALAAMPAFLQVPIAAVVGVPLYVCASGATPLAAVAIHKGLSAGAALTFLLAGPASNVTTFGVLSKLHGRSVAVRFGVVLTVVAILTGWAVDLIGVDVPAVAHPGVPHTHRHGLVSWFCLIGLACLGLASLVRMGARGVLDQVLSPIHAH
jgi:uncharacterized protein